MYMWSKPQSTAVVLNPGPGEPQGVLGSSTPGPGEPQGVLGSSLLVLESRRVCWGPHSWSWRAAGCAGVLQLLVLESSQGVLAFVLNPGPGESQGVFIDQLTRLTWCWSESVAYSAVNWSIKVVDYTVRTHLTWFLGLNWLLILGWKQKPAHPAALQDQGWRPLVYSL